jgi:hypothetical protein
MRGELPSVFVSDLTRRTRAAGVVVAPTRHRVVSARRNALPWIVATRASA